MDTYFHSWVRWLTNCKVHAGIQFLGFTFPLYLLPAERPRAGDVISYSWSFSISSVKWEWQSTCTHRAAVKIKWDNSYKAHITQCLLLNPPNPLASVIKPQWPISLWKNKALCICIRKKKQVYQTFEEKMHNSLVFFQLESPLKFPLLAPSPTQFLNLSLNKCILPKWQNIHTGKNCRQRLEQRIGRRQNKTIYVEERKKHHSAFSKKG